MGNICMKFGGTSMGTAESIRQVAEIVMAAENPVVVVSATSGTTDRLIAMGQAALAGRDWATVFDEIVTKHQTIIAELGLDLDLTGFWAELREIARGVSMLRELSLSTMDRMMTFGERSSAQILAAFLENGEAVDAYEIVFTDNTFSEGVVDFERTDQAIKAKLRPLVDRGAIPVVTGFVAQAENGQYITLGRGGSDYTCAIIGAAMETSEVQIWTDVDGILNTDPRLVDAAEVLEQLSYNEAGELAYFGAKVLHPKTIKPAIKENIPVRILNTFNPKAEGTLITAEERESVKSVTYKKGISTINVCSAGMLEARGFLAKIFEVFARYEVSVDVVSTSEVSVSMTVEKGMAELVVPDLNKFATVEVREDMAIVCLVGEGIKADSKVLGQLFSAVDDYDVSMVSQGASKRNITFVVEESDAQEVVKTVFNQFFNKNLK